jgi:hypothetical protein
VAFDADDTGVTARQLQRIALDQRVVLLIHPAARRIVGGTDQRQNGIGNIGLGNVAGCKRRCNLGRCPRTVVFRAFVAQFLDRQVGDFLALMDDAEPQVVGGLADDGEIKTPFDEDRLGDFFLGGLQNHEHALLAFGQHHFIGRHALFAHRHLVQLQLDAEAALGAHFDSRAGKAGSTHVLDGDDGAGLHQLEAGFEQAFFGEGVADLYGRALLLDRLVELGRCHGGATDAVTAGLGTEIDDRQADALGFRQEDRIGLGKACSKSVDEDIAVVAGIEFNLAANRRHTEGIAIAADTGNDAGDEVAGLRMIRRTEAQRVHGRDRTRTHGEHVAQNAADAGRSALIGLDVGRVVVALHLEDNASPSSISTTPAFSPGPWITRGPVVGSVRSHFFEDL